VLVSLFCENVTLGDCSLGVTSSKVDVSEGQVVVAGSISSISPESELLRFLKVKSLSLATIAAPSMLIRGTFNID
jgi:hypothetical protein